jgi:hypothetical protein
MMTTYGLYVRDRNAGDLVWFTASDSLQPGRYFLGRQQGTAPNVYVADSIASLILEVGSLVQQVENSAQSTLGTAEMTAGAEQHMAEDMTEGLLQRLTETSAVWIADPDWIKRLPPASVAAAEVWSGWRLARRSALWGRGRRRALHGGAFGHRDAIQGRLVTRSGR